MHITLCIPVNKNDWETAAGLVKQYTASLKMDLSFQNIDKELENLSKEYGKPQGCFFIAALDSRGVGCVGLRRYENDICEMKRLYVQPDARGHGIGKLLIQRIIEEGRKLNYKKNAARYPANHGNCTVYL